MKKFAMRLAAVLLPVVAASLFPMLKEKLDEFARWLSDKASD